MIEVLTAELRDRIFLSILMIRSQLSRHSLPVFYFSKCCTEREWPWLETKSWHSCLWVLNFPHFWCELKELTLRCGTNHSVFELVWRYCSKSLLNQVVWPEFELLLGLFICFLQNPPTLGPWALLVVQVDDASPTEMAMWKNCSSQSWDYALWWQSVCRYSSWQSDLLNFQFLLWE